MALVGDISVKIGLNATELQQGLATAERNLKGLGKSVTSMGTTLFTSVSLPLAAIGVGAIKVGADFEKGMKKVEAVTGATGDEIQKLEDKARELGKSTKYSAGEVADAFGFLGMAGFKTNDILDSTGDVLNLASISGMELAQVADITSNMLSGLGLGAKEAGRMADVMARTMTNSNVDVAMLGETFKYVAPTAKDLGFSLEELSASIGFLGDAGIQGSMAGTSLATGLSRLADPVPEAEKMIKNLGMSFFDTNGTMKKMPEIVAELEKGLMGMSDQQRVTALSTIFGLESMKSWSVLVGRGSDELANYTGELEDSEGASQKLADTMNDTLYGRLDTLKASIQEVGISLYEKFEEPLKKVVEKVTEWVTKLGEMDTATQGTIIVLAGLGIILPPLVIMLGLFIQGISSIVGVFKLVVPAITKVVGIFKKLKGVLNLAKLLPLLTGPIGIAIVAIGGLIAIGVALWKNWDVVKAKASEIWSSIKETVGGFASGLVDSVKEIFSNIAEWFSEKWQSVKDVTMSIWESIKGYLITFFTTLWEMLPISYIVDFIVTNWETIKETTKIIFEMIATTIQVIFSKIASVVSTIATGIWNKIKGAWEKVKSTTISVYNSIKNVLSSIWNSIMNGVIIPIVSGIWNKIKGAWDKVSSTTSSIYNSIKNVLSGIWDGIRTKAVDTANGIWTKVKEIFGKVKDAIVKPIEKAQELVRKCLDKISGFFSGLKLEIPKPKIPKISVTKKTGVMGIPYPDFDISWNAKGNIFDGASILGGGQGVGEAGAEVVMPIERKRYMKPYASMVADLMNDMGDDSDVGTVINNYFTIEEMAVRTEDDIKRIAEELERLQKKQQRAKGKLVFA